MPLLSGLRFKKPAGYGGGEVDKVKKSKKDKKSKHKKDKKIKKSKKAKSHKHSKQDQQLQDSDDSSSNDSSPDPIYPVLEQRSKAPEEVVPSNEPAKPKLVRDAWMTEQRSFSGPSEADQQAARAAAEAKEKAQEELEARKKKGGLLNRPEKTEEEVKNEKKRVLLTGDGGASWRARALRRAKERAQDSVYTRPSYIHPIAHIPQQKNNHLSISYETTI